MALQLELPRAEDTEALGARLARACPRGISIHLLGELAAGKTTLACGYLRALGHTGAVKSPTFTLVETYTFAFGTVHHFDLYRIAAPPELEFIGVEEYLDGAADCLIEWADRGRDVLPVGDIDIRLAVGAAGRQAILEGRSERGSEVVSQLILS